MPKKPMKSTGKVAPSKVTKPSKMSSTGSKKMASKYGEKPPVVGPATKKEAIKQGIKAKPPLSAAGAAKKRKDIKTKIAGMGATVLGAAADMINTKRRLTGKSYIPTKRKP